MDDLRTWAELHVQHGNLQAKQVLELLMTLDAHRSVANCATERAEILESVKEFYFTDNKNLAVEMDRMRAAYQGKLITANERIAALEGFNSDNLETIEKLGSHNEALEFHLSERGKLCGLLDERIKELEADLALARKTVLQLSERVAAQSELLSRRAEREPVRAAVSTPQPEVQPQPC